MIGANHFIRLSRKMDLKSAASEGRSKERFWSPFVPGIGASFCTSRYARRRVLGVEVNLAKTVLVCASALAILALLALLDNAESVSYVFSIAGVGSIPTRASKISTN
jgi:hypothetical protein